MPVPFYNGGGFKRKNKVFIIKQKLVIDLFRVYKIIINI